MGSSIRRSDLLALSNLRNDGRKPHEIRRLRVHLGVLANSTTQSVGGSALVEMGLTVALATVAGPMECQRRSDELVDRAIVQVTVKTAPFSANASDRRSTNPNTDRRLLESAHWLQRALEATILLQLHPKSRIVVNVCILADDGSRWCAAVNATTLALVDAGIPLKDFLCACSAGWVASPSSSTTNTSSSADGVALVDMNRREEASQGGQAAVYLPLAMLPQRGTVVLAQCEARLDNWDMLERVMEAATEGCKAIFEYMQTAVREHAALLLAARQGNATISQSF